MSDIDDPGSSSDTVPLGYTIFTGKRWTVFKLAFLTGCLTVLTAGIYRFWAKTRLRRYYWSSIRPGGVPLEYVGDPGEKFLGFLVAVTFLAFYIGIVNLILMFFSYAVLQSNFTAYLLSFAGVIPIWFYARYRAWRYVLARTRWRGIRFGLEPGAWGYAWRAMVHWAVTILTLGLLWPRMTFWLEKFKADRTWFGDLDIRQGGKWTMLAGAMVHLVLPVLIIAGVIIQAVSSLVYPSGEFEDASISRDFFDAFTGLYWIDETIAFLLLPVIWFVFGLANYKAVRFSRLSETKDIGGSKLISQPKRWKVFRIYLFGNFVVYAGLVLAVFVVGLVLVGLELSPYDLEGGQQTAFLIAGIAIYFLVFVLWGALGHAFVTLPLWQHFSETLVIQNLSALDSVGQRARDEAGQAEGFAEALDVGAAI